MFVNHRNSKSRGQDVYVDVIKDIEKDGVCPFCFDNIKKYHKNSITEKKYWLVTDNMYPYRPSRHHCLIIYKNHIESPNQLNISDWQELFDIVTDEIKRRAIEGGTFIMRFGNTHYTGASVSHLHAHIVQSDPESSEYSKEKGLVMRIG